MSQEFVTVTPSILEEHLARILTFNESAVANGMRRLVPYITGDTGIGKSGIVDDVLHTRGYTTWDVRCNLFTPPDLQGFPYLNKDNPSRTTSSYAPPLRLPMAESHTGLHAIKLEELPNAENDMLSALYQMTYDHQVGDAVIKDDTTIIALGNRLQDHGNVNELPQPLKQRLIHFELSVDIDDSVRYMHKKGFNPMIPAFIRFAPQYLHKIDHSANVSPTPRGWEMLNTMLSFSDNDDFVTMQSCIGLPTALMFQTFCQESKNLPDIDQLIASPHNAPIPEGAVLYQLCAALAHRSTKANFKNILAYVDRLDPEYSIFVVRDATNRDKNLSSTSAFIDWATKNAEVFL